ncbi:MAG: isochorismatase family protein [Oscillospiraceae bacterium]|nr:isochorismatase family protein [Oscillospiraceae bacterium]MCL2228140.1 isochorismatase family protein [Oscillospiraceae bacterium]
MLTTENTLALVIDFQDRMMPSISNHGELTRKSAMFIKGCRILGVPILTTQQYTKGLGETVSEIKDALVNFEPIEKLTFSCFGCDEFEAKLKNADKKNIFITGVEAHICVQQTVLHLLERSYCVYILADCIGARSDADKHYAERRMEKAGAIITTAESALFEMMIRADHPHRKDISSLVK